MSGLAPFFITGATAKIKLNDRTVAFCQDFQYTVNVRHASPKVLGRYEVDSLEPLSYEVSGSFSVVRYARDLKQLMEDAGYKTPQGTANDGNGLGSFSSGGKTFFDSDGRAGDNMDPSALKFATFFNIEVYQKTAVGQCAVARIRDCRVERSDFQLAGKRAPATQRFTFKAIFVDEDSFSAGFSGTGQQFG